MDELIYGVWKGRAYDNRRTIDGKAPEGLPLSEFLAFNLSLIHISEPTRPY